MILEWSFLRLKIPWLFLISGDHWHDSLSKRILESLLLTVQLQGIPDDPLLHWS